MKRAGKRVSKSVSEIKSVRRNIKKNTKYTRTGGKKRMENGKTHEKKRRIGYVEIVNMQRLSALNVRRIRTA